ncbi:hypothetical protein M407DRAFT_27540 [Tulasnella calospora MUT 4182]|uniref:Uncharacterized protein n=1 Tax=Tulasnella calospora MUT 4182 TaxID=1051891 RepID=A0A0C3Q2Z1_9AGAM|nr:hypothetical protein M407DRAFT_27540 [Tulasnella calospora MUT 4182]
MSRRDRDALADGNREFRKKHERHLSQHHTTIQQLLGGLQMTSGIGLGGLTELQLAPAPFDWRHKSLCDTSTFSS